MSQFTAGGLNIPKCNFFFLSTGKYTTQQAGWNIINNIINTLTAVRIYGWLMLVFTISCQQRVQSREVTVEATRRHGYGAVA